MAKKEHRVMLGMVCQVCKHRNYITSKNKVEQKEKITLKKYCKFCKKHTDHKESEKLD